MALTLSAFFLALDQKRFLISTRQADRNDIMQKQMDYIFITEQMYIAKMMIFILFDRNLLAQKTERGRRSAHDNLTERRLEVIGRESKDCELTLGRQQRA